MSNAEILLSQSPELLPDIINEFIKFARRKNSKLENFDGMDELTYKLNRRGVELDSLWETIKNENLGYISQNDDEVTNE